MTAALALLATIRATLTMIAYEAISAELLREKTRDGIAGTFVASQAWKFDGGEAVVVPCNIAGRMEMIIFIRIGGHTFRVTGYQGIAGVFENPPVPMVEQLAFVHGVSLVEVDEIAAAA